MASVEMKNLRKSFGKTEAARDVSLTLEAGEMFFLLGPSGCGKTTCLRLVAGFETPDSGEILFDGRPVTATPPHRRGVGMVFQTYALFPHMNVRRNVEYGLRNRRVKAADRKKRIAEILGVLRIGDLADRMPAQLSGGQQQRVALARALVIRPDVLLLDEPLSNLDTRLRAEVRDEIGRLHAGFHTTTLYVTHDQEEALSLADRMAVMRDGIVEQIGSPREIYRRPANSFVAAFVGDANLIAGRAAQSGGGGAAFETSHGPLAAEGADFPDRKAVILCVRPERVVLEPAPDSGPWRGRVASARFFGAHVAVEVEMPNGDTILARVSGAAAPRPGEPVRVCVRPEDVVALEQ